MTQLPDKYSLVDGDISDGYHTFNDLYAHRNQLFIALINTNSNKYTWKSKYHSDGNLAYEGYFIAGLTLNNNNDITYHLPLELWHLLECEPLDKAPTWDGHTSQDVLQRLHEFNRDGFATEVLNKLENSSTLRAIQELVNKGILVPNTSNPISEDYGDNYDLILHVNEENNATRDI